MLLPVAIVSIILEIRVDATKVLRRVNANNMDERKDLPDAWHFMQVCHVVSESLLLTCRFLIVVFAHFVSHRKDA